MLTTNRNPKTQRVLGARNTNTANTCANIHTNTSTDTVTNTSSNTYTNYKPLSLLTLNP